MIFSYWAILIKQISNQFGTSYCIAVIMLFPLLIESKPSYTFKGASFPTLNFAAPIGASLVFGIVIFRT